VQLSGMMRLVAIALTGAALWGCSSSEAAPSGVVTQLPPTTISVSLGTGTITAEIAATVIARDSGLMGRTAMGADTGMLFVYQGDQSPAFTAFWMHDTLIPLSIAFMDSTKHVINIDDMAANTDTYHFATAPYRYALEVNQGWFASHGVTAGTAVTFTVPAGTVVSP
jgi:uncharacterized membrane protein (UPF0127 family)